MHSASSRQQTSRCRRLRREKSAGQEFNRVLGMTACVPHITRAALLLRFERTSPRRVGGWRVEGEGERRKKEKGERKREREREREKGRNDEEPGCVRSDNILLSCAASTGGRGGRGGGERERGEGEGQENPWPAYVMQEMAAVRYTVAVIPFLFFFFSRFPSGR